jgi:1-acyl-sn-glycerol-3-phosphate acyltransferase
MRDVTTAAVRPPSPLMLAGFTRIARRRLSKGFRAVRMLNSERLVEAGRGPLIVYLNHPSWWDPLLCLTLARTLLPKRKHYAPISAASLVKFRFFGKLGMFPVDQESSRGAVQFLHGSKAVLAAGDVLWITAQGRFSDVRERPVGLKAGLGALLARHEGLAPLSVLPLALEYTFWNGVKPEALAAAGLPLHVSAGDVRHSSQEWTGLLAERLQTVQDELAAAALERDPLLFETLLDADAGGVWQRMRARMRGELEVSASEKSEGVR